MRRVASLLLCWAAGTVPVAAQGFSGTVIMKLTGTRPSGTAQSTLTIAISGDMTATTTSMFGQEVHVITDQKSKRMTILMPTPPGVQLPAEITKGKDVRGVKIVKDFDRPPAPSAPQSEPPPPSTLGVKKLGTTQTIAGVVCDDYEVVGTPGAATRMCVVKSMGRFVYPQLGGGGAGPTPTPLWARAFGKEAIFPLKVWSVDGKMAMEVVSIRRGPIPAATFLIPDDYIDMPTMPGRGPGLNP